MWRKCLAALNIVFLLSTLVIVLAVDPGLVLFVFCPMPLYKALFLAVCLVPLAVNALYFGIFFSGVAYGALEDKLKAKEALAGGKCRTGRQ